MSFKSQMEKQTKTIASNLWDTLLFLEKSGLSTAIKETKGTIETITEEVGEGRGKAKISRVKASLLKSEVTPKKGDEIIEENGDKYTILEVYSECFLFWSCVLNKVKNE